MRVQVITRADELARLEGAWDALVRRVSQAPPFVAPAWLLPWWETFSPGPLCTIAVWSADRLLGLAPLYVEPTPEGGRLLPLGIGLSDWLDVLVDPEQAAAVLPVLAEAVGCVAAGRTCWSAEDAPAGSVVLTCPPPPGWTARTEPQSACPGLDLSPATDGLPAAIPARQRRKWRMARHRLARRSWTLTAATAASLPADLDALVRLHAARWETRGEAGVLADPTVQRFHAGAAPRLLAAGLLRMLVLRIEERVAGVYYGLQQGATACAYLGGFDPDFAFESPGTVLIGAAIEQAAQEGCTTFSFLRGQEPYKYAWGATDRWTLRRTLEPPR